MGLNYRFHTILIKTCIHSWSPVNQLITGISGNSQVLPWGIHAEQEWLNWKSKLHMMSYDLGLVRNRKRYKGIYRFYTTQTSKDI